MTGAIRVAVLIDCDNVSWRLGPAVLGEAAGFTMPGRLVHTGRRRHTRLPARWPCADAVTTALGRIHAIPLRC